MPFLKEAWYCAGWLSDLADKPTAITICGEEIAIYQDSRGQPVAVENRCPHRFAPMAQGRVVGDLIECPYHGLQFDAQGACALNPHGQQLIPPNARLKTYRLESLHGAIWIWMGDPETADPSLIPPLGFIGDDRYAVLKGHLKVSANYKLLNDNLLDLTHSAYIHTTTVGLPPNLAAKVKYTVRTEGNVIRSERFLEAVPPTPQFLNSFGAELGDIYSYLTWYPPSSMLLDLSVVPRGTHKRSIDDPDEQSVLIPGAHLVVPETEHTAHYFYAVARSADIHDADKNAKMAALSYKTFAEEDRPMIEECYRLMGSVDFWDLHPAILESDRGGIMARRILSRLIAAQEHAEPKDMVA